MFVKIMYDYGLRDLYRNNFEDLHCKFFQLEKLMQVGLEEQIAFINGNTGVGTGALLPSPSGQQNRSLRGGAEPRQEVLIPTSKHCESGLLMISFFLSCKDVAANLLHFFPSVCLLSLFPSFLCYTESISLLC